MVRANSGVNGQLKDNPSFCDIRYKILDWFGVRSIMPARINAVMWTWKSWMKKHQNGWDTLRGTPRQVWSLDPFPSDPSQSLHSTSKHRAWKQTLMCMQSVFFDSTEEEKKSLLSFNFVSYFHKYLKKCWKEVDVWGFDCLRAVVTSGRVRSKRAPNEEEMTARESFSSLW